MGLLICNLAPGLKFRQDTLNTLKYIHFYFLPLVCPNGLIRVVSRFARKTWKINPSSTNVVSNSIHQRYLFRIGLLGMLLTHADNRPVPKPHFSALPIQPPPTRLAPAVVQAISTAGSGSGRSHSRASLVPVSRSHRMSSLGGGNGYQAFGINGLRRGLGVNVESEGSRSGNLGFGMTEKDIDERVCYSFLFFDICFLVDIDPLTDVVLEFFWGGQISKAVEAEVARRMAERERERAESVKAEESEVAHMIDSKTTQSGSKSPEREQSLPSGILTPLLKRHRELDDELKNRLQELEQK